MHALITGANRGLGLEFSRQLLARGHRVIATARQPSSCAALNHLCGDYPGHLSVLPLDAAKPASITELAREAALITRSLDLLIVNAGVNVRGERFGNLNATDLQHTLEVNTVGPVLLAQEMIDLLKRGQQPRVVYISSILGSISERDSFYVPSYCISKAALNMAMRVLSFPLRESGIQSAAIHPGWVKTDMGGEQAPLTPEQSVSDMLSLIDRLDENHCGRFLAHDGRELAW
jgi:NAD(P)-dependent dehydrogenase (short-subunit alcohol dehydrogenase family)